MPTASLNGTTIHYETAGSGPMCLFMHGGLGLDHAYFRPEFDRLSERMRLVFYDMRCNGRSGRPPLETLTMEQLAGDADALVDHLGETRAIVLGHSYGTFVAQELALSHPDRVAALVLIGSTPGQLGREETPAQAGGPPPPPEVVEIMSEVPRTDAEFAAALARMAPHYVHRLDPGTFEAKLRDSIVNVEAAARGFEVLDSWSSVDRLPQIRVPVLLLVGSHDVHCSPSQSYRIARHIEGAEVVEFAESAHFPWLDEPDRFFSVLEGWLDRVGTRSG